MLRALRRQPVDRLPTQSGYTGAMGRLLAAYFGISPAELPKRLGNHLVRVDIDHPRRTNADGSIEFDWWGAGWDTRTEGYWHAFSPLADSLDLDRYPWPDPNGAALLDTAARTIVSDGSDYFIAPNLGMCLFERAWSLRGFDALLMDMVERTVWVEQLLDRIVEIQAVLARRFVAAGVAGGRHNRHLVAVGEGGPQIGQGTVDGGGHSVLRQSFSDRGGEVEGRRALLQGSLTAVREFNCDLGHRYLSLVTA